ncbi:HD-GYP domain-containing protein [Yoonia sp. SS1-5]|uniref:HD-GYP domain-containing protein n=1 Tax=Yoonia rhodophyticola TaxID=3137370 RepID=A0AAN0NJE3_9RHOB
MSARDTPLPGYSHFDATRDARMGQRVKLPEVLGALSHALDLTQGQPRGHALRCCWIGTQIGTALGLTPEQMADLYYVLLLKDLGCSSNAAAICALYQTDDIAFKHDFKLADGNLGAILRFVLSKTGVGLGVADRMRATLKVIRKSDRIAQNLIQTRCQKGADIAERLRFSAAVQDGIRCLDEHWDGSGRPQGLAGHAVPLAANIALLAQVVDVFHQANGRSAAATAVRSRGNSWFDPSLVDVFLACAAQDSFWSGVEDPQIETVVFAAAPARADPPMDDTYLDDIAYAFADVIDAKSPFTADHSRRVMLYADMIAGELGFSADHRTWLRRVALLHDVGKLAVSNTILDKPGRPSPAEWDVIRSHPTLSAEILTRVSVFADMAPVAAAHHERLDGKGYPNGLNAKTLSIEAMVLTAADVFDALSADRPYRSALPVGEALQIMRAGAGTIHHPTCLDALERGLARLGQSDELDLQHGHIPAENAPRHPGTSMSG